MGEIVLFPCGIIPFQRPEVKGCVKGLEVEGGFYVDPVAEGRITQEVLEETRGGAFNIGGLRGCQRWANSSAPRAQIIEFRKEPEFP